jgi:Ala-tRNA(Pro) deacylase
METAIAAHVPDDHIAKGVLLKSGENYMLVVIPASQWVDLHRVEGELGDAYQLAEENEVPRLFPDCDPGAIPPLGEAYGIDTVIDEALMSLANIYFESGDHEQLVHLDGDGFRNLMHGMRHGHFSTEI